LQETILSRWTRCAYSALLMVIAAALVVGGVTLLIYGGSIYYLFAGTAPRVDVELSGLEYPQLALAVRQRVVIYLRAALYVGVPDTRAVGSG